MLKIFGLLTLLVFIVPILVFFVGALWLWQKFTGGNKPGPQSFSNHTQSDYGKANTQRHNSPHKQIFKDNEGEYVDFQEVDKN